MRKIILFILLTFLLGSLLVFSGCISDDYDMAIKKANDQDYEEAIEMFIDLGDYKDSEEQLTNTIYKYGESLVQHKKYEKAISLYGKYLSYGECKTRLVETIHAYANYLVEKCYYSSATSLYVQCSEYGDFSKEIDFLEKEKAVYDIYYEAMKLLESGACDKGFEKFDTLPDNYKRVDEIKQSYYELKDSRFQGHYSNQQGRNSQSITFNFKFNLELESFCIHAYKAVYWSDGSVYKDYNFYITADKISENTIKVGKFTWTVNDEGSIIEMENAHAAIYTKIN